MISQSSILALGTNFLRASILSFLDIKTCSIEYLISDVFFMPANSIVDMLFNLRCLKKSKFDPFFKNLGPNAAKVQAVMPLCHQHAFCLNVEQSSVVFLQVLFHKFLHRAHEQLLDYHNIKIDH